VTISVDLTDRVALVTGGARGVGRGITERLLAAGARVVVCGRNEPDEGALPDGVEFVAGDVRDPDQVDRIVTTAVEQAGRLDIAVNNAGGAPNSDAATASARFSERVVSLNMLAALQVAQRANAQMQTQTDGGVIVNVGSMSGLRPTPGTAGYGAAKAGLLSLTGTLAVEWAPKVRVNMVSAGIVRTEAFADWYGDRAAQVAATIPLGRVAEPADVGNAVAFLASPLASYISGANIVVNGGGEQLEFFKLME